MRGSALHEKFKAKKQILNQTLLEILFWSQNGAKTLLQIYNNNSWYNLKWPLSNKMTELYAVYSIFRSKIKHIILLEIELNFDKVKN